MKWKDWIWYSEGITFWIDFASFLTDVSTHDKLGQSLSKHYNVWTIKTPCAHHILILLNNNNNNNTNSQILLNTFEVWWLHVSVVPVPSRARLSWDILIPALTYINVINSFWCIENVNFYFKFTLFIPQLKMFMFKPNITCKQFRLE